MADGARMMEVFTIVDKEGFERSFWVKVGACFPNRDGSLNVYLDALPLNGRLQIRERNRPQSNKEEQS
jgi:hypothetical protein